ncbi:cyclase [Myxococcota bacterium]|nr:cyclase [Myxococcota bacterium]
MSHLKTITSATILAAAFLLGTTASAAKNPNPWEEVQNDEGITVWTRDVPKSNIREVKATAIVNLPLKKIAGVILDVPHYTEFMPYVEKAKIMSKGSGTVEYQYQLIDPPFVDERDYTLKTQTEDKGKSWRHYWTQANSKGPAKNEDVVRVEICDGEWTLIEEGPSKTKLTYWLYTDPGGSIPSWIANKANKTSVPALLDAVRNRAANPKWKP